MYETFYHLTATPFRLTPDPKFCFSHSGYAEARAYLQYAFELGEGFIILTGRPGAGKTTLIESFLRELDASGVAAARIAPANLETTDLLRAVAFVYDIQAEGLDKATLLRRIAQYCSTMMYRGRRVLLVVDEAQGLSHSALEELRLLADLQEGARPLLQIFLVGQEKLRSIMREPHMEQLQQRVIGTCRLGPMGLAETKDYVRHRLCRAGWTGDPELTGAAILAIFQYSGGVPRHINKMCTRLLLHGFLQSKHILDKDDVLGIAHELDEELLAPACNGESRRGEAGDDAALVALQEDSISLSDLAVRALQRAGDALPPPAPPEAEKSAAAPSSRREPAPAATNPVAAPRPSLTESVSPDAAQPRRSVFNAAQRRGSVLAARVLPSLLKLPEKPPVFFGVVAAITVTAAAVTSYFERYAAEQHGLFVVHSQPLQAGQSATHAGENREAAGSQDAEPELRGQDVFAVASALRANGQVAGGAMHENTRIDDARRVSQPSGLVSSAAVGVSPTAAAGQVDSEPDSAEQAGGNDDHAGAQDSAQSVAVRSPNVSLPDRSHSDGQAQVITHVRSADSTSPAVETAVTDVSDPVARAVPPPANNSPQPLSRGRAVGSVVSVNERISRLLVLAGEALRKDRLTTPARRSAYKYYQQVLTLEPGNADALDGLGQIVERYVTLIRDAIHGNDKAKANRYLARALRVRPRDERLLALKDSMNTVSVSTQPERPAEAPAAPLGPPPPKAEQPRNVFQRLKDFFSRN